MIQYSYLSRPLGAFTSHHLEDIVTTALFNNTKLQVSAFLFYFQGYIWQILEGPSDRASHIYQHIKRDQRHQILFETSSIDRQARSFKNWAMAYEDRVTDVATLEKFGSDYRIHDHHATLSVLKTFVDSSLPAEQWRHAPLISRPPNTINRS